jgi:bifunctional non-homologous end joining protein LigD
MRARWERDSTTSRSRRFYDKLEPLITKKSPFTGKVKALRDVTWVKPELVAEIKYLEITPDGLLRAPVFIALRTDKDPKEPQDQADHGGSAR